VKSGSIFVVDYLDADILQFAAAGVTVIFNGNSTSPLEKAGAAIKLSTDSAVFKTAWCVSWVMPTVWTEPPPQHPHSRLPLNCRAMLC
jgi:hypothetical protein